MIPPPLHGAHWLDLDVVTTYLDTTYGAQASPLALEQLRQAVRPLVRLDWDRFPTRLSRLTVKADTPRLARQLAELLLNE